MLAEKVSRWIDEYIAEGRSEGIIEGRIQGILTVFRRMKDSGMSIQEMAKITGLSEDEIIETRYLEGDPNLELIRRDFSFFFQKYFNQNELEFFPNPFCGEIASPDKVKRWIACYKSIGRSEGIIEGRVKALVSIIYGMFVKGMSLPEISAITKLSEEEIQMMISDVENRCRDYYNFRW